MVVIVYVCSHSGHATLQDVLFSRRMAFLQLVISSDHGRLRLTIIVLQKSPGKEKWLKWNVIAIEIHSH